MKFRTRLSVSNNTVQCVSLAISTNEHVKFILRDWMIRRANFSLPTYFC